MLDLFKKKIEKAILTVSVNDSEICRITSTDLPCEIHPSIKLSPGSKIEFKDSAGISHEHSIGDYSGWFHFSVRVSQSMACQIDCAITQSEVYDQNAFSTGQAIGIRFQPFFLTGAQTSNDIFVGRGLFKRGLHYSGTVTNGSIMLSCECDQCRKSFLIRSFHAGFSQVGYFYSDSGRYTLTISDRVPGAPGALLVPDASELAQLESELPRAPDGTTFKFGNPFRCPHCSAPYIDFVQHPEERPAEYYGNYFDRVELMHYEPASSINAN